MKPCTKCGQTKAFSDFSKSRSTKTGYMCWCKLCVKEHDRNTNYPPVRDGDPKICQKCGKLKDRSKFYIDKRKLDGLESRCKSCCKIRSRSSEIMRRYGVTETDYQQMLVDQGGNCAICDKPVTVERLDRLSIDHCHDTGKIRGLLCSKCNLGIGIFLDDPELLKKAVRYLEEA